MNKLLTAVGLAFGRAGWLAGVTAGVTITFALYPASASAGHPPHATNGRIAWTQSLPPTAWTIAPAGGDPELLSTFPTPAGLTSLVRGLSFSADGSKMAVMYEQSTGTGTLCGGFVQICWSIILMNGDGSDPQVVFSSDRIGSGGLALSPDGGRVAFTMVVGGPGGNREPLFTVDSGGNLTQLTTPAAFQTDADATWSPSGKLLAFESSRDEDAQHSWSLYVVNSRNHRVKRVIRGAETNDLEPDWSPDGKRLVFLRTFGYPDYRIYTVNANGSNQQEVLRDNSASEAPVWSPDGTQILYSKDAGSHSLAVVDASGTNDYVVEAFGPAVFVGGYDWRPNG
jgi:Tol biopolymer transport system component